MIKCPNCSRDEHEAPLTQKVAAMYSSHRFDADYDPEADDSPIMCPGSFVCGPARPSPNVSRGTTWSTVWSSSVVTINGESALYDPATETWTYKVSSKDGYHYLLDNMPYWPKVTAYSKYYQPIGLQAPKTWGKGFGWLLDESLSMDWKPWGFTDVEKWAADTLKGCAKDIPEDAPEITFGPVNWLKKVDASSGEMYTASQVLPTTWQPFPVPESKSDYKKLADEVNGKYQYAGVK